MKIYPSPHEVRAIDHPHFLDIPIAHVEEEIHPNKIIVQKGADFSFDRKTSIAPYDTFQNDDFLLFDSSEKFAKNVLEHKNAKYIYVPKDYKEFTPTEFGVSALTKKHMKYLSDRNYNLRVGVFKNGNYSKFAKKLMPIFGNAPYRGAAPANITVNGGSQQIDDFYKTDGKDLDFLFIETYDGINTKNKALKIDFDALMSYHANIWLSVDTEGGTDIFSIIKENEKYTVKMFSAALPYNTETEINYDTYGVIVRNSKNFPNFPQNENTYHHKKLFDTAPLFVIERPDKSFIVASDEKLFDNLDKYGKLIYNVMMYCVLNGYTETKSKRLWITDYPVDYMGALNRPFHKRHEDLCLDDLIDNSNYVIDDYDVVSINTDKEDILLDNIDDGHFIHFSKLSKTDIAKEDGMVSIYSVNHSVMLYKAINYYQIESNVIIDTEIDEQENCYISVRPFKSSKYKIIYNKEEKFRIKKPTYEYVLIALPIDTTNISTLQLIEKNRYAGEGLLIANISIEYVGEKTSFDIRQLGGGLPKEYTDYEMLDIGNLKGRPYRIGTGSVIVLPKRLEKYDDRIQQAIADYKVAANRIYIVYE